MDQLARELRLALRRLRLSPGFTLFAVASLALGIGVSTAIYSAVRTLFWRPLGVPGAAELVAVTGDRNLPSMSWLDFADFQTAQTSFRAIGASTPIRTALVSSRRTEVVPGDAVSGGYFNLMGVGAAYGRLLTPADERDAARVAVISERFWRAHFAGDPAAIGQTVRLGGQPFEIVGVVKGSFHGLERFQLKSIWVPMTAIPENGGNAFSTWGTRKDRRMTTCFVYGRLKDGVSLGRGFAEVNTIGQRLDETFPLDRRQRRFGLREQAANGPGEEFVNTVGGMILTAVAVLLMIACSNLANLALAKGTSRAEETAVRSALGASRWRLVREQLIECGLVVAAGGAVGLGLLSVLVDLFTVDLPFGGGLMMTFRPEVDVTVLGMSAASMIVALLVFGLWPALQGTRSDLRARIGTGASATPTRWRLHQTLIAWQVCGCVALMLVASMAQRVIGAALRELPATVSTPFAIAQVEFSLNNRDETQARRIVDAVLADVRSQPGIERAVASTGVPVGFMVNVHNASFVTTPDRPFTATADMGRYEVLISSSPGLFETIGLPVVRGRGFTDRDDAAAPQVAVISEQLARDLFGRANAVGETIVTYGAPRLNDRYPPPLALTVVGVAADPYTARSGRRDGYVVVPWTQRYDGRTPIMFTVRSATPDKAVALLRASIRRVDPDLAITLAGSGDVVLQGPIFLLRIIRGMATALATISLVLAMAGLFGVLMHLVLKRTREIGIRIALGAERSRIFRMIVFDGLRPVGKGITLGLMIGVGARIALRAWVVTDISAYEPLVLVVPVPFALAALVACYVPAVRASRVDPNVALRHL